MKQNIFNRIKITAFFTLLISSTIVSAASIIVTRNDDLIVSGDGGCDLRDAINSANINFALEDCTAGDANTMDEIIINVAGPIQLTSQIDIIGSTSIAPDISIPRITIQAAANNQIFLIHPFQDNDDDFHMKRMRLINGDAGAENGGALLFSNYPDRFQSDPIITLTDIEFENNTANAGGAIYVDHIWATEFKLNQSKFINNSSNNSAGHAVILIEPVDDLHPSIFEFNDNQVESNISTGQSGSAAIGIFTDDSTNLHLIRGNRFINNNGGLKIGASGTSGRTSFYLKNNVFFDNYSNNGGALIASKSEILLINNTFANNSASEGGAIFAFNELVLEMVNNTLVYNQATLLGANIRAEGATSIFIGNSILAHPIDANNCSNILVNINSTGGNVDDDGSCSLNTTNDVMSDPLLSVLTSHSSGLSGFVPTLNSPAIDNSPNQLCLDPWGSIIAFDQQGNVRTTDGDGEGTAYCDSGAIEAPDYDYIWANGFESL